MTGHLPIDLAYAAGIIDGEGTIGITEYAVTARRRSPQFRCYVAVVMTDSVIPAWLAERFGGTVHSYPPRRAGHRGATYWRLQNRRAAEFCELVEPYLQLKTVQARVLIAFYNDGRFTFQQRRRVPDDEVAARREYVSTIHGLNARGTKGAS